MTGPTFVCEFVDGVVTRMTTHCPDGLDPARGIRLSRAAYESRRRRPPPEILKGHFENGDGVLLQTYDAAAIKLVALAEQYPACFSLFQQRRKPLKIGIHQDVMTVLGVDEKEAASVLRAYTWNTWYLGACTLVGAERVGLDGEVAGYVTEKEAAFAKQRLAEALAKRARREAAATATESPMTPSEPRLSLADLKTTALARRARRVMENESA